MEITVNWKEQMHFEAELPGGGKFDLDADGNAPTPMQALLASVAACTAMDVVSILAKKRQAVTSYRLVVEGDRSPEGEYPRGFKHIRVRHIIKGEELDPIAVARAIQLSDEKYCSVSATLKESVAVTSSWGIED